jgi:hypothetical protein
VVKHDTPYGERLQYFLSALAKLARSINGQKISFEQNGASLQKAPTSPVSTTEQ